MADQNQIPMHFDMINFTIREMTLCGEILRAMGSGKAGVVEIGDWVAKFLYNALVEGTETKATSLVRFFKTTRYGDLTPEQQEYVDRSAPGSPSSPDMRCLVLSGTAGEEPAWNYPEKSKGHRIIPLPSRDSIRQLPMVENLLIQWGLPPGLVIKPDPKLLDVMEPRTYNIFLCPKPWKALSSPSKKIS